MHYAGPLDLLPIWGVFLATVAVVLLAVEGGFRLGQYQRRRSEQEDKPPVGEMVAATLALLALLAFMLAFTFGLAASRFDVRSGLVIDEANAIGTTYLRAGLLPDSIRCNGGCGEISQAQDAGEEAVGPAPRRYHATEALDLDVIRPVLPALRERERARRSLINAHEHVIPADVEYRVAQTVGIGPHGRLHERRGVVPLPHQELELIGDAP